MNKIINVILLFIFIFLSSKKIADASILFQEDFSSGLEKWQSIRTENLWSVVDGKAEANVNKRNTITELVPKNEYWNNEWKNYQYELDFSTIQGSDKNISFGVQNKNNWYEIHFYGNNGNFEFARLKNGSVAYSKKSQALLKRDNKFVIRFDEGNIKISLNGQIIFDEFDPTFNNNYGKIGIKAGTGVIYPTKVQFDNIIVRSLDDSSSDTELNVPHQMQSDTQWSEQEYDHAASWATNPTIKRWGCALTSLSMIMNFHGINKMPDGNQLNPETLNNWLKAQPDGYIGAKIRWPQ